MRDVHRRFGLKFWAFVSGGASLPAEVEQFWNALGFVLVQGYGMTETTALATLNHPMHPARGSIGKPLAGREVRVAEDGEILVRGPMLAAGTWRDGGIQPRSGDWLHTGDLGAVDASGEMRFLGRKSDVIVAASGMNIHPEDLEQVVAKQAGVRDCIVVGWDSPRGPEPVAVVILHDPTEDASLTQILSNSNRELQEFQQIRNILRWPANEFPRNTMGKLLRREVSAWAAQQLRDENISSTLTASQDPLLRLLQQVTGQRVEGLDDSAELASDLHLDSLGRMQLTMAMEEQFGVSVSDSAVAGARTLADLRKLLSPAQANEKQAESPEPRVPQVSPLRPGIGETSASAPSSPRRAGDETKYPHWPWSAPVQFLRMLFIELKLRPLVWLLAHPRVQRDRTALPAQPSIYVANHVTAMDVPLILYALPHRVRAHMAVAMSAELLAAWRRRRDAAGVGAGPLRWLAPVQAFLVTALLNVFPLPAGAGLRRSFAHAGEALDRGYNVLVFPEGRRTLTGELQPFQTGISLLAQESHTQVVPIALVGLWAAAQRRGFSRLRPPGLEVRIGQPLQQQPERISRRIFPTPARRRRPAVASSCPRLMRRLMRWRCGFLFCNTRHGRRQNDFRHNGVRWRAIHVVGSASKHGDQIILWHQINFLPAIALRRHQMHMLRTRWRFHVQPRTPPEISVAHIVNVAMFCRRGPHPGRRNHLLALPAPILRKKNSQFQHVARTQVNLRILFVGVGQVVIPFPVGARNPQRLEKIFLRIIRQSTCELRFPSCVQPPQLRRSNTCHRFRDHES